MKKIILIYGILICFSGTVAGIVLVPIEGPVSLIMSVVCAVIGWKLIRLLRTPAVKDYKQANDKPYEKLSKLKRFGLNLVIFMCVISALSLPMLAESQEMPAVVLAIISIFYFFIIGVCISILRKDNKYIKTEKQRKLDNQLAMENFQISKVVDLGVMQGLNRGGKLLVDDNSKKFALLINGEYIFYNYSDLIAYELNEDGSTITSGRGLQTAVGAATFGLAGAMVGSSGKRKNEATCTDMRVRLLFDNLHNPQFEIILVHGEIKKNSINYNSAKQKGNEITSTLNYITNYNSNNPVVKVQAEETNALQKSFKSPNLAFNKMQVDNLLRIIEDCKRIVNTSKKIDTVMMRLDVGLKNTYHLKQAEEFGLYSGTPTADDYIAIFIGQRDDILLNTLKRMYEDLVFSANGLKTEKGRYNRYKKFFDTIHEYDFEFEYTECEKFIESVENNYKEQFKDFI